MIGGCTAPRGSRTDLGALLLGYYDGGRLRYAGKVGTGFTQATLRDLAARLAPAAPRPRAVRRRAALSATRPGSSPSSSPRSASRSGRATAGCATRASSDCATTRPRGRWCGSEPDREGGAPRDPESSSADRVVFDGAGLTKLDLARYYADVADAMVPHVRDRPLALHTFPKGVGGEGYFAKNEPRHFPDWIATVDVPKREGGTIHQVLANDAATLVYLAGQNAVALHVWTSRADRLERPDRLVFDLDPTVQDFAEVRAAAREAGELLRDIGLVPYTMTTGSRGLHVVAPLQRRADYEEVHAFGGPWPTASRPSTRTG